MRSSIAITIILSSSLIAEMSFEQWQKKEEQSFNEWQKKEEKAFTDYQTKIDREFVKMLKESWGNFEAEDALVPYQQPKPSKIPTLQIKPNIEEIIKPPNQPIYIAPIPSIPPKQSVSSQKKIKFNFFSIDMEIVYNKNLKFSINTISDSHIAEFWNHVSSNNYMPLINDIKEYQNLYQLDDWTTYLLVQEISKNINHEENSQNLLSWFILIKLGINAKVGITHNNITLLVHSQELLYSIKYFTINTKRYYNLNRKNFSNLTIYKGGMNGVYAMNIANKTSKIPFRVKNRELKFSYQHKEYILNMKYNQNLLKLYRTYPQMEYYKYLKISNISRQNIKKELSQIISNMSEIQAINFLLRLTQNGFEYKTDNDNFGYEKVMFFEETLGYSYSDCEDRAIFFSMLIKELLGLDILFIKYPNHLATAIRVKSNIGGDSVIYNNRRYYIADPTYNNANIGQAMPQLKGMQIKILKQ
jgi:hypothetical protein